MRKLLRHGRDTNIDEMLEIELNDDIVRIGEKKIGDVDLSTFSNIDMTFDESRNSSAVSLSESRNKE